jgi:hypothetical protein
MMGSERAGGGECRKVFWESSKYTFSNFIPCSKFFRLGSAKIVYEKRFIVVSLIKNNYNKVCTLICTVRARPL